MPARLPEWLHFALIAAVSAVGGLLAVRGLLYGCRLSDWLLIGMCVVGLGFLVLHPGR